MEGGRATAGWLALRERADAAARSTMLLDVLASRSDVVRSGRSAGPALVVHDLGSGTGSMRRWMVPRLPKPQRWVEHDRDRELAAGAADGPPDGSAVGSDGEAEAAAEALVKVVHCGCDVADLSVDHLGPVDLVTASALLDVVTAEAVDRMVTVAAELRVPLLLTLTVVGRVRLDPADPLDDHVTRMFNDHQRRCTSAGQLLGPDAVTYVAARLADHQAVVRTAPSPWRLERSSHRLAAAWFRGWLDAAVEQDPDLMEPAAGYRTRRLAQIGSGTLGITVEHTDLLAWWS